MARRLEDTLATRLRELATERKLPISHVADRCGLAHSYFWQLLAGKASASLAVVQRLAEALDVEPLMLLTPKAATKSGVKRKDATGSPKNTGLPVSPKSRERMPVSPKKAV